MTDIHGFDPASEESRNSQVLPRKGPPKVVPILCLLAILVGLTVVTDKYVSADPDKDLKTTYRGYFALKGLTVSWDLDELIESSNAVVLAEVGDIKYREYPRSIRAALTHRGLSFLGGKHFLNDLRAAFHEITVIETLMGEVPQQFLLAREDIAFQGYTEKSELKAGERFLLFIRRGIGPPQYTASVGDYYTAFDEHGIFDYAGTNRVYPKVIEPFYGLTPEEDGFFTQGTVRPFFALDKIRAKINAYACFASPEHCLVETDYYDRFNNTILVSLTSDSVSS